MNYAGYSGGMEGEGIFSNNIDSTLGTLEYLKEKDDGKAKKEEKKSKEESDVQPVEEKKQPPVEEKTATPRFKEEARHPEDDYLSRVKDKTFLAEYQIKEMIEDMRN